MIEFLEFNDEISAADIMFFGIIIQNELFVQRFFEMDFERMDLRRDMISREFAFNKTSFCRGCCKT